MGNEWLPVRVKVEAPPRGAGEQEALEFVAQSMMSQFAWGSSPGTATIVYVGGAGGRPLVTTGAWTTLTIGRHLFCGVCKSDVWNLGAREGETRTLQFVDLREFLTWDWTFCAFNKLDVRLVNGVRVKRYRHMYPANYDLHTWTYTNGPLLGWEIVSAILGYRAKGLPNGVEGGTVGSPWTWDLTGLGLFPQGVLVMPIYDFDCLGGKRLDAALSEICERAGTVFGLFSTLTYPYRLVFTRMGYGLLPMYPRASTNPFPLNVSDQRRLGTTLSGHPTNVRVLGERNLYQVLDVEMQKDWAVGWEKFGVFEDFAEDIYLRGTDPRTGKKFTELENDAEHYQGRQLANALALEITVRRYAELRNGSRLEGEELNEGDGFVDNRKFAGRSRMDMPAALYLSTLLYRAFRPGDTFEFRNVAGKLVPLTSLDIADQLLCKTSHDVLTGVMDVDVTQQVDGNGYAIAKGYMVGSDLFKSIRSDQFSLEFFRNSKAVWEHVPFQIDDSGEGVRFIIFDEPVIVSEDLILDVDGQKVINAKFHLQVPPVRAALVFEAERYSYWKGTWPNVSRDVVENVNGLMAEYVVKVLPDGQRKYSELTYANGEAAAVKADAIASATLLRQYLYMEGGFKLNFNPGEAPSQFGLDLTDGRHSLLDRIQVVTSASAGTYEIIDFTNERQRDHFEPEREMDRRTMTNSLFPGQAELRTRAEYARKLAGAFRQNPRFGRMLTELLSGAIGSDEPLTQTWFRPGSQPLGEGGGPPGGGGETVPIPAGTELAAGTPIWKKPTVASTSAGQPNTNTVATYPPNVGADDTVFVGIVVRQNEDATKPFKVQARGRVLARVMGPVTAGDAVGKSANASDWLEAPGGAATVGKVLQSISSAVVKLVAVELGVSGGAGGGGYPVWL